MTDEERELKIISDAMVLAEERWNGTPWQELSPQQRAAVPTESSVAFYLRSQYA